MPELNKEQFDELPEFAREQYVEDGDGYSHKGMMKVKQTADTLDSRVKELSGKIDSFEDQKREEIEKARAEALEEARSKGDAKAIEERYQQQLEDLEKRRDESERQYKERLDKMSETIKRDKKTAVISELSEIATDKGRKAFKALLSNRVDVDPETGDTIFLDDDGRATSLDMKGFLADIQKDDAFSPLIQAKVSTRGGGNVQTGNNDGGRAPRDAGELVGSRSKRTDWIRERFPDLED